MSTLNAYSQLTLAELAKRKDPTGNAAVIVESLAQDNEVLQDAVFVEANDTFSNRTTRRASLPSGSFRKLNAGVAKEASDTITMIDTIGILETYSKTDVDLVEAAPSPKEFRMQEARAFIEGLGQTMASSIFYANTTTDPEKFTGFAPRMDAIAATANVINEGGTGSDLTSIYVVDWGPDRAQMIYPKGSMAGLQHKDKGVWLITDASDNTYEAYVDKFQWKAGLVVRNERCMGRIANIKTTGASNVFDEDNLITLLNRMIIGPGARIYVNKTVKTQMEIRLKDKTNVNFSVADGLGGVPVMRFRGIPVRMCDKIIITEAALT